MGRLAFNLALGRLSELIEEEHGGCDQNTCDIAVALRHGFDLWAIQLFSNSGAASDEFTALFDSLDKRRFNPRAELQRKALCEEVLHVECPYCNAVVWCPEEVTDDGQTYCDSCARTFPESQNEQKKRGLK